MKLRQIIITLALGALTVPAFGQKVAVKTNALYWATTTPNLAVEFGLGPRTTLDVAGGYNPFTFSDNKKLKHYLIQPEVRHWFCERFAGWFLGIHAHGGEFNVGGIGPFTTIKDHRYEGWFAGAGIGFGYQWVFSPRWGLEAEIGAGYAYLDYDKYPCEKCGRKLDSGHRHYFGPTRLSISLVYNLW